jgi:1-deoxy-D-xylulose-5-phosphate synthase
MSPKDEDELQDMMFTASIQKHPVAIRYPRGNAEGVSIKDHPVPIEIGKAEVLRNFANNGAQKVALFALGNMQPVARQAIEKLVERGLDVALINPRFYKPLDEGVHEFFGRTVDVVATLEDATTVDYLRNKHGLTADNLVAEVTKLLGQQASKPQIAALSSVG